MRGWQKARQTCGAHPLPAQGLTAHSQLFTPSHPLSSLPSYCKLCSSTLWENQAAKAELPRITTLSLDICCQLTEHFSVSVGETSLLPAQATPRLVDCSLLTPSVLLPPLL